MTQIEVPDWVLEQAFNAWCDVADVDEWRVRNSREALQAALRAALAEMLEPIHGIPADTLSGELLYRIRGPQ